MSGVVKAFGGLLALDSVDLVVSPGDRLALLGPNGAGKTTLFNVIAGDLRPTSGQVHIAGIDCTYLAARHRSRLGLARTYQRTRLFGGLTVGDNLYLAEAGMRGRHRTLWRSSVDDLMRKRAAATAERVWLGTRLHVPVAELSHGERRQLEVGMALAAEPSVLLLDEPASGLSRGERRRLIELLAGLPGEVTLVLIEHDMDVALATADRVVVMADGRVVASGSTEEIRHDPLVHDIYLGRGVAS